ncbi:hypothetical protein CMO83_03130 [Candidatus Woesearchaeota archaeon]|jgi:hypothetical protein|nr:hypothetical protein [Candidatus Woesearchaeota archaeon]|tara:strand:+ start:13234 stop:13590 length:357 start_codon:yes stop_codon:yes gene_type:complete
MTHYRQKFDEAEEVMRRRIRHMSDAELERVIEESSSERTAMIYHTSQAARLERARRRQVRTEGFDSQAQDVCSSYAAIDAMDIAKSICHNCNLMYKPDCPYGTGEPPFVEVIIQLPAK